MINTFFKIPPILSPSNYFSATYHNYSNTEKEFTEKFLSYWISFVKYNDPNYLNTNNYWQPFVNSSVKLNKLNASQKISIGRYLVFGQNSINMNSGFSSHNCDFWNYTSNSMRIFNANKAYIQQALSLISLKFIVKLF